MSDEGRSVPDGDYRLEDRYDRETGRVQLNGDQALVRILLDQSRRDHRRGLHTAGFVSGYRGSPLGGFDMAAGHAKKWLEAADVRFEPGVNEDLAATAIWGTQQASLMGSDRDGVFSLWYGKGPGVDRSGDALKHGNLAGVARHGGVLVVAGDDPGAKSSSLAHQSEPAFVSAGIPVLYPATLQDALDFGAHAWELSRLSGCWVGFKMVTDLMDSSASVQLPGLDHEVVAPGVTLGAEDYITFGRAALAMEESLVERRLPLVGAYWRANGLDVTTGPSAARVGIVSAGRTYVEVRAALDRLGVDEAALERVGLRLHKVGMSWPLETQGVLEFARGLGEVLVVEEKQPLIEQQVVRALYDAAERPRLAGRTDVDGRPLVPGVGELTADMLVPLLERWLSRVAPEVELRHERRAPAALTLLPAARAATFCAGCPHNLSTKVPDGAVALGGIGCHGMAVGMEGRNTLALTHMGAEGANWIGMAPFVDQKHVFQNLGDGTFYHSGLLAVRAAVAAGANITYKVLANGAIAMTGGQPIEGEPTDGEHLVPDIVRQLRGLGVERIVVLNDGTHGYPRRAIPKDIPVKHRDHLDEVQRELAEVPGVTAIVFDQFCAAEARRLRKRGRLPVPEKRMVINQRVCEGCGDCNRASNCIAVEPVETRFGRKRQVNQSSCNLDLSCVKGYCPSFVTVTGGEVRKAPAADAAVLDRALAALPEPAAGTRSGDVLITGVGGTGISTAGAVLGMAGHLDGAEVTVLNQTGLAQKNGPVSSHVRIRPAGALLHGRRIGDGGVDLLLAADLLTTMDAKSLALLSPERTRAVVDLAVAPTGHVALHPDLDLSSGPMVRGISGRSELTVAHAFKAVAGELLSPDVEANMLLLGYGLQQGWLPVSVAALDRALELNGVAVELNRRALALGRLWAADPQVVSRLLNGSDPDVDDQVVEDVETLTSTNAAELVRYQDRAYADRYESLVRQVRAADERIGGDGRLGLAVARYFYKLLAYKDEYEVARLYTEPALGEQLDNEFASYSTLAVNLAPQRFFPKDRRTGRPKKVAIPGWLAFRMLRVLASMKWARGGAFDIFGRTDHRRRERALVAEYEQTVRDLLVRLDGESYDLAIRIAEVPEEIRGFGDIKDASIAAAAGVRAELLAQFEQSNVMSS